MARRLIYHPPTKDRLAQLRGFTGGESGLEAFLNPSCLDVVVYHDDFLGDLIRGSATSPGIYEVITTTDGAINILADQTNGVAEIRASDGTGNDNEYCGISLPELNWTGDRNAWMAARIAIDAITTVKVEVGFTDVTTDAGAVNDLAAPTKTADDFAVWCFDTDDTAYWQCVSCVAGGTPQKIEPSIQPTAATFETLIVQLHDTDAKFMRLDANGNKTYESDWISAALTKTDKLCPWIFVQLRAGTIDRNVQLDMIHAEQLRTTTE